MNKKIVKIVFEIDDGTLYVVDNPTFIDKIKFAILSLKITFKKSSNISVLRRRYFAMLHELHSHTSTGYTKEDLHENLKPLLLKKFYEFPHYFKNNIAEYSTKNLTLEGWTALIEQLKTIAHEVFNYNFKT